MTRQVHTITAPAYDDYGWGYQNAVIAFYQFAKSSTESYTASEENQSYQVKQDVDTITYTANFWGAQEHKDAGCKSKPLYALDENNKVVTDDSGKPSRVFEVDASKPQYKAILARHADPIDGLFAVIEQHYKMEVAQ